MKAMILAAGFGTRLRPLTEELPKPLVPVLDRPLVEHTIAMLVDRAGVDHVVMNLHHLADAIPAALGDGARLGVHIDYVVEEGEILGTGGGILNARHLLDDGGTFIVVNGDVLLEPDVGAALALHRSHGATATLVLREDPRAEAFGSLEVDPTFRVRKLLGRPEGADGGLRPFMFTGLHLLEPEIFELLPEAGCIVRTAYRHLVDSGGVLCGHVDSGPWVELGTVEDYLRVNLALASGELRLAGIRGGQGCVVAEDAEIDDPALLTPPAIVGSGARVRAAVERAVVWPGATVETPVTDAVVTPRGIVRPRQAAAATW